MTEPDDVRRNMRDAGYPVEPPDVDLDDDPPRKRGTWIAVMVLVFIGLIFLGPVAAAWWFAP